MLTVGHILAGDVLTRAVFREYDRKTSQLHIAFFCCVTPVAFEPVIYAVSEASQSAVLRYSTTPQHTCSTVHKYPQRNPGQTIHCSVSSLFWACRYSWDYVMVFEVRAEDKELTVYQRKLSMKEILTRLNVGGKHSWENCRLHLSYVHPKTRATLFSKVIVFICTYDAFSVHPYSPYGKFTHRQ